MLLPLIGFIISSILISAFGIIFLIISKDFKLNIQNIFAFDCGAMVLALLYSFIFNLLFTQNGNIESTFGVISYLVILLIMILIGGVIGIKLLRKIFSEIN